MNTNFLQIISASSADRKDLFLTAANRFGTPIQNIEKDFWVCCVLDLLFNGRASNEPRLLFKGGTSLSKGYGLISRFSEDIDITVFREDIIQTVGNDDLAKLSGKKQRFYLDTIKHACQTYIQGLMKDRLNHQISVLLEETKISPRDGLVMMDPNDSDQQTLLFSYPSVIEDANYYVKPTVKIEAGAKSALDPHRSITIKPYLSDDVALNLSIDNIITIDAERTFWDKIVILHGLRSWHDKRSQLRQEGHRISRHYYDIYQLYQSDVGQRAKTNYALAIDCALHAQLFFNSRDLDLKTARPGTFRISPSEEMIEILRRDYQAMIGMVFGKAPEFINVFDTIRQLEIEINR